MACLCSSIYIGEFGECSDGTPDLADLALHIAKAADQYQLDVTENLEDLLEALDVSEDYVAMLKALPDLELGPMLKFVKKVSVETVAENLCMCKDEELAKISTQVLVEIIRAVDSLR